MHSSTATWRKRYTCTNLPVSATPTSLIMYAGSSNLSTVSNRRHEHGPHNCSRRPCFRINVVATARRRLFLQPGDSNIADWGVASSSASHYSDAAAFGDLSLGFNAAHDSVSTAVDGGSASAAHDGQWNSSAARKMQINYGLSPDMGMFVVAPAATFLHHHNGSTASTVNPNRITGLTAKPPPPPPPPAAACIGFEGGSTPALGARVGVIPLSSYFENKKSDLDGVFAELQVKV
ncbi:unnamed protein product [Cuscuta epithymum]|uniref:Uncharacterized protein n=1 Tax=Cuscuta epithymum TaxID=186058 RepID=A0AAV0C298_9ASTE|nr:unnamed protein product [Cuscuta epithymum]